MHPLEVVEPRAPSRLAYSVSRSPVAVKTVRGRKRPRIDVAIEERELAARRLRVGTCGGEGGQSRYSIDTGRYFRRIGSGQVPGVVVEHALGEAGLG